jgi:hypothetical protein
VDRLEEIAKNPDPKRDLASIGDRFVVLMQTQKSRLKNDTNLKSESKRGEMFSKESFVFKIQRFFTKNENILKECSHFVSLNQISNEWYIVVGKEQHGIKPTISITMK